MSAAERKKKYLEALKANGKMDEFRKKHAAQEKQRSNRAKERLKLLPRKIQALTTRLKLERARKATARHRERKRQRIIMSESDTKASVANNNNQSYKTDSARYKAAAKIKRALPSASQKKREAFKTVLESFNSADRQFIIGSEEVRAKQTRKSKVTPAIVEEIQAFYERDDISRMSANVKDVRSFVDPVTGSEEMKQTRFLMYKLPEVYDMFVKNMQNGKKTFISSVARFWIQT